MGLTAGDDRIYLVLREEAVWIATNHNPTGLELAWVGDLREQFELFAEMGGQVLVEGEADLQGSVAPWRASCQLAGGEEIGRVLAAAEVVLNV